MPAVVALKVMASPLKSTLLRSKWEEAEKWPPPCDRGKLRTAGGLKAKGSEPARL